MTRKELEKLFSSYPDVVDLQQFRQMLGGIGDGTARKLMQEQLVQHYVIRCTYYIPKQSVIEYVMSKHYKNYSKSLKAQIKKPSSKS